MEFIISTCNVHGKTCFDIKVGYGTSQDNPGRDVPFSVGPGTKIIPCPFVPGQGQEQKSQDKLLCSGTKSVPKKTKKGKGRSKTGKGHS